MGNPTRKRPWYSAASTALLLATVMALVIGLAATSSATHQVCNDPEFCVWANTSYGPVEHHYGHTGNSSNWPCGVFCSPDVDNNEDSVVNTSSYSYRVFDGDNYQGSLKYCVDPGQQDSNINNAVDNDGQSSLRVGLFDCPSGDPGP